MSKELTREQVEGVLQYIGTHVAHLSSPDSYMLDELGINDAAQRATIQQLEAQVKALESELKAWHNGNGGIVKRPIDTTDPSG